MPKLHLVLDVGGLDPARVDPEEAAADLLADQSWTEIEVKVESAEWVP